MHLVMPWTMFIPDFLLPNLYLRPRLSLRIC